MGLYDTFVLKIPIQCGNCYSGGYYEFQTKDLECTLDVYTEGEPAVSYGWREINEEEKKERHEEFALLYPGLAGTGWEDMCGMFRIDKSVIMRRLADGVYLTYTWCPICKTMFYVPMEVKNGIFVGVHNG
jgi:hypothetical protein